MSKSQTENKKLILNADDFGMSGYFNEAVLRGFNDGILTSACACANGEAFEQAIKEILPQCKGMGFGVHLNIFEGKALSDNLSLLAGSDGIFRNSFQKLFFNAQNKKLLAEIEKECRLQIEKILSCANPDHINSHVHIHAIPQLFEIVCKLATEYKINYIRTQYEHFYTVPNLSKHLNTWYPINLVKLGLLNNLSRKNKKTLKKYGLKTNDYLAGVGYTGFMDAQTIKYGVKALSQKNCTLEILIHPCSFDKELFKNDKYMQARHNEFLATQNAELREFIIQSGWELTNYLNMQNA